MIGDGSGSTFNRGCGWATWVFRRHHSQPNVVFGGYNYGTNNIAEIMAYLQGLLWYESQIKNDGHDRQVHIVTDSEYVAGRGKHPGSRKKHRSLWAALDTYPRRGIMLNWHWLLRDRCLYNMEADALSRHARINLEELHSGRVVPILAEHLARSTEQPS
jgi:ribonuclease HI